jgi:hypothetical protein
MMKKFDIITKSISLDAKEKKINFIERIKEACSKSLINTTTCESWKSCGLIPLDPIVILKQCYILTPSFIPSTFTDIQNICWMMNKMQIITPLEENCSFLRVIDILSTNKNFNLEFLHINLSLQIIKE